MPATQQVITELIVDARPAAEGERQFEATMAKASAAAERQSAIMLQTGQSAGKLGAQLERLKAQADPLYAAQAKIEKQLGTLDAAYRRGMVTEGEAATIKARLIAIQDRNSASLIREGAAAGRAAEGFRLLKDVGIGFAGGIGAGILIGGVADLPRILSDTVEHLGNIANKAQTIGITTDALQQLRYAARLSDVEIGTLDDALTKFSVNAGKMDGPLRKIFEANGKAITGDVLKDIETYGDLIKNATDQEQRNVLVTTAFGKSAAEMGRLFDDGGRGIARWAGEARAAGAVMDNSLIERARVLNDQMEALKPQLEAAQAEFAMLIVPAELAILSTFNELIAETRAILTDITNLDLGGLFAKLGQLGVIFSDITTGNWIGASTQLQMMQMQRQAGVAITVHGGATTAPASTKPTVLPSTADDKAARAAEQLKKAYDALILSTQQKIAQSELEQRSIGLTAEAALKLKNEQDLLQQAQTKGIDLDAKTADGTKTKRQELIEYADQLTEAQIATKKLQDAQEEAQEVWKTVGDTISEVFSGGIKSFDEFVDHLLNRFADLGQQNLSKLFSADSFNALFGNQTAANDNGSGWGDVWGNLSSAVEKGSKEGTKGGFGDVLKGLGGNSTLSAALGGVGIGYQSQNPLLGALGGAASGFMAGGVAGAVVGGIAGLVGGLFGMNEALEKSKKELEDNRDAINQFIATGFGDSISSAASAVAQFNSQGAKLIELAKAAGDSDMAAQLQAAIDAYKGTLETQFNNDIQSQINELTGNSGLNDVNDALEAFSDNMANVAYFGGDATDVTTLLSLELKNIISEGGATVDQINALAAAFPDLADQIAAVVDTIDATTPSLDQAQAWVDNRRAALSAAYQKESAALQDVINTAKNAITTLKNFKESLQLSEQSPLSPYDQMMAAKATYDTTAAAALSGDQDAIAKLPDVMQSYLQTAQGYYANSAEYAAIFDQVNATLDEALAKATDQVDVAQAQLDALDKSVAGLIDINDSVLSVVDAIASLKDALAGLSAAGGFDAQSYWSSTLKDFYAALQDYKATTGSSTIPSEIAGVWNAFANASSAAEYDRLAEMYASKLREITSGYSGTSMTSSALTSSSASSILSVPSAPSAAAANSNSAIVSELKALRATTEKIISATATSAIHVAQRVDANTDEAANAARAARHEQRRTGTNG